MCINLTRRAGKPDVFRVAFMPPVVSINVLCNLINTRYAAH